MEFDWLDVAFDLTAVSPREIEETFEDPFAIKLLPDEQQDEATSRFVSLGKSLNGKGLFSVFWTDGKRYRVVFSRIMTQVESNFYERKKAEEI